MAQLSPRKWRGEDDVTIAFGTDAWLETAGGIVLDLTNYEPSTTSDCGTCGWGLLAGIFAPVNDEFGIEACDECRRYPGDLDAARALADYLNELTGWIYTVHYYPAV